MTSLVNQKSLQEHFKDILAIIGFSDEREEISQRFFATAALKALTDFYNNLSEEQKKQIDKEIKIVQSSDDLIKMLKKHFSEEEIGASFADAAKKHISQIMKSVYPTMSENQRMKLDALIKKNKSPLNETVIFSNSK